MCLGWVGARGYARGGTLLGLCTGGRKQIKHLSSCLGRVREQMLPSFPLGRTFANHTSR